MKPTREHKHAAILRAIADGKEVQFKGEYSGEWLETNHLNLNPITHSELEWRIKPEPKPDVVFGGNAYLDSDGYLLMDLLKKPNIRLTFDGETGKLKKAEVLE